MSACNKCGITQGLLHDESDHRHRWVISAETFWTEHGGDIRLIWCEVCRVEPGAGEFPMDLEYVLESITFPTSGTTDQEP
jgi:hypothetical protein